MSLLGFLLGAAKDKAQEYNAKKDLEEKLGRKVSTHEIYSLSANLESAAPQRELDPGSSPQSFIREPGHGAAVSAQTNSYSLKQSAGEPKSKVRKFVIIGSIAFLLVSALIVSAIGFVMIMPESDYDRYNPFTPKPAPETIPKASAGYNLHEEPIYYKRYLSKDCNCNAFKAGYYFGGKLSDKNPITYTLYDFKSADEAKKYFTDKYKSGRKTEPLQQSDSRLVFGNPNAGGLSVYLTPGRHMVLLSGGIASDVIAFENNLPYAAFGVEKPPAQSADALREESVSAVTTKSETKSSLVGKWKSNSPEGWEFKSDNKFQRMTPLRIPINGTYSVNGENVLLKFDPRNEKSEALEPLNVKITVRGDEMTIDDGQRKYTYARSL